VEEREVPRAGREKGEKGENRGSGKEFIKRVMLGLDGVNRK
jgi:hypothetical protein